MPSSWLQGGRPAATAIHPALYCPVLLYAACVTNRDRLFEAGFDDDVTLDWLAPVTGHALQLPTSSYAQYLAVAVVAGLGVAGEAMECSSSY